MVRFTNSAATLASDSPEDKNFFWPERCKIIEVVKYKDEAVTIVVRYKDEAKTIVDDTIPSADLIAWMAAGKIEKVVGGSKVVATACAKILILDDPNERPAGWDYKGEFFGAILEASQTDPRFRESVVYSSNGSYKSETSPAVPTLPYLSFYWALDSYGSRSAWSFDIVHRCSRAVVLWQNDKIQMIDHVKRVLGVVEHPLFMSACFRSAQESTQREDYEESRDKINTIERKIGYFAFLVTDPEPMDVRPDLAGLSRRAGHRLADVGRQQLLLSLSVSVRQNLCIAEKYRWAKWFPDNRTELDGEGKAYAALCEAVLRLDDDIEQYLRASQYKLIALQERAKTLLTVVRDSFRALPIVLQKH